MFSITKKVLVDEPTSIDCTTKGVPSPSLSWYKADTLIDENYSSRFQVLNQSSLTLYYI